MQPGPYREAIEKQQFALSTVSTEASTQPSSSIAAASSSNPPVPPLPTEDAPPSYEDSTKVNNPGPLVPDRVPELPERAYEPTAHQTAIEIPTVRAAAQPAYEEIIGDLVRVPSGLTMIRPEDKSEVYKNPSVWLGIICVASGLDLAWGIITFAYVLATFIVSRVLMIIPLVGIPINFAFAITWRVIANVEIIYTTTMFPTKDVLRPYVPPPIVYTSRLRDYVNELRLDGSRVTGPGPTPAVEDISMKSMKLTAYSETTRRITRYFSFQRFIKSLVYFIVFWCAFFPVWLIVGILFAGFFFKAGKLVWPMASMIGRLPKDAITQLSARSF
ncbi:hypothetical protein BJ742DRAFT_774375 [Cladochytrium replicatum]|nr:hypothetical protein BJ742DRAFT_774375 [Cladochytrium replicatum]